jgi:aminoglycoside 3-N-acetyltransferase
VGANSPFTLLPKFGGKILMLGCGLYPNTFMHAVEEAAKVPYVLTEGTTKFFIEHADGWREETLHITHDFRRVVQRYEHLANFDVVTKGKVLDATAYLMDATAVWDVAFGVMVKEPWYFVDRV